MSENTFEEKNNLFRDYKTNSFDDGDLQTRLYAKIYYEPNNQEELRITNIPRMSQDWVGIHNNIAHKRMQLCEENIDKSEDEQHMESEDAREQLICNNTLQIQIDPIDSHLSVYQTCNDKSQEVNSMDDEYNSTNNKSYSAIKGEENSVEKHKPLNDLKKTLRQLYQKCVQECNAVSSNDSIGEVIYSKYNIRQKSEKQEMLSAKKGDKDQQISDGSDSEVSVFEIPVPPKPKPLVIELQDSDEENAKSVDKDNLHQNASKITNTRVTFALHLGNSELEVKETSSGQVISPKNKNTSKSQRNKNTVNIGETTQSTTHMQEIVEDIVLNCSPVQKVASSTSEIRQLSKNTEINQNQENALMENTKHKKRTPQNTKKYSENNDNLQQDTHMISSKRKLQTKKTQQNVNINNTECNVYDLRHKDQDLLDMWVMGVPYSYKNEATKAKRKCNSPIISNVKHKRQCTIQQSSQNVTLQDSNDKERTEGEKYSTPTAQEMRNYYNNSTCGQENLDVSELQRNMSKDPKMWTILDEDRMPCPRNRQRTRSNARVRCGNCHQDGHQQCYACRKSPCYMCGIKGHSKFRCSLKKCLTCGKKQNKYCETCESCRVLYCSMCNSVGHKADQCPDLWRRYHQTTDMSNMPQDLGNTMKPSYLLSCCNCTKRGHESSTCRELQGSRHFLTPAAVTNYTDGPTYNSNAAISSECHTMNISPPKTASNETSIPQNVVNTQQAMGEHSGLSANVNLSSSSEEANKMPISQEAMDISQTEEIVKINKISENQEIKELIFTDIFYRCGKILNKNKKKLQIIYQNLSTLATLSPYGKTTVTNLEKGKVSPSFLKALIDKNVQFEVKIGFTECQGNNVMLQLLTFEKSLKLIHELLLHWINLPHEEKDYGIDVTLPKNSIKMFNFLSTRMPQFQKMGFTSYDNHSKENDPRQIFNRIKSKKSQLEKYREQSMRRYNRERKILGRMQTKLLMITNTEPKPNRYVYMLQNAMKELELKQYQMSEPLDIVTYLKFTLLHNILFVPHTPTYLFKTLHRFEKHAEKQKLLSMPQQQELERRINEQKNRAVMYASHTNMNLPYPSITPSQDINFVENLSIINVQQNASNNITNDILPINNTTNNDCDETMISDPTVQIPSFIISFNTESTAVPSEDFTSDINIESFVSTSGQNAQSTMPQKQTKSEEERFKKPLTNKKFNKKNFSSNQKKSMYDKALKVIAQARKFRLSHMTKAADELQRKVDNQMLTFKHISTMKKLVKMEKKHQKNIISCCSTLKIYN